MSKLHLAPLSGANVVTVTVDRKSIPSDIEEQFDIEGEGLKVVRFVRDGQPMTLNIYPDRTEMSMSSAIDVTLSVEGDTYMLKLS